MERGVDEVVYPYASAPFFQVFLRAGRPRGLDFYKKQFYMAEHKLQHNLLCSTREIMKIIYPPHRILLISLLRRRHIIPSLGHFLNKLKEASQFS